MKTYYIESHRDWFVVNCRNKNHARLEGIYELGRNCIKIIREATPEEIKYFKSIKGENALDPCI